MNDRRALITAVPALTALGMLPASTSSGASSEASSAAADIARLVETYASAWLRGDRETCLACYHEEFTLHYYGDNALTGDHIGKARSVAALRELALRTGWRVLEIKRQLTDASGAALVARVQYRSDSDPIERDRVLVFAVRDGLLSECWAYDQDVALMDRLIGRAPLAGTSQPR